MSGLFRPEMISRNQRSIHGDVFLHSSLSIRTLITFLSVCAFVIMLAITYFRYNVTISLTGVIGLDTGIVKVLSPKSGVVEEIFISEGSLIEDGSPLLSISTERNTTDGQTLSVSSRTSLQKELEYLRSAKNRIQGSIPIRSSSVKARIVIIEQEIEAITNQLATLKSREELELSVLDKFRRLLKDEAASVREVNVQESLYLTVRQSYQALEANKLSLDRERISLESELNQLPLTASEKINEISRQINKIEAQLVESKLSSHEEIHSSTEGKVSNLTISTGSYIATQQTMLTIIPSRSKVQLELFSPPNSVGLIEVGQKVRLRYDAFPYRKYGIYDGIIEYVSGDPIVHSEWQSGSDKKDLGFIIVVKLEQDFVSYASEVGELLPGMTVSADVIVERKPLWKLVLG